MKTKIVYFLLIMLLGTGKVFSQQNKKLTALTIDDTMPDINLGRVINFPVEALTTSDFKGKLLILDFWATTCSGCLQNFSKIEKLQKQFINDVQFLAVTFEDKKKIINFFASPVGQKYQISSVVNDTLLGDLFPHTLIPHCVWIDGNGIVRAITGAESINEKNIRAILSSQPNALNIKKDINAERPLFLMDNFPIENEILNYSILSKGTNESLPSGTRFRRQGEILVGRAFTNENLLNIYEAVMRALFDNLKDNYSKNRLILDVRDTSKTSLTIGEDGRYSVANQYNFDLIVPVFMADSLYHFMLRDLNRYTAFYGRIEKRKIACLILKRLGETDKMKTKGKKKENSLFYKSPAILSNYPLSYLVTQLNDIKGITFPVVDETQYAGNVDIKFSGAVDINSLTSELHYYGLDLVLEERILNMFILSDK